jgi:hypothetical protein
LATLWQIGSAVIVLGVLVGCAETGDFGRRRPSLFEGKQGLDASPEWFGSRATLTDIEIELRNRAIALSRNPEKPIYATLDALEAVIGSNADIYYGRVAGRADLSVTTRYKRVERDVDADFALIPLFRSTACKVASADALRLASLSVADGVSWDQAELARIRVASNAAIGEAVERALPQRVDAYHIAAERLFAASPDEAVKSVIAAIDQLRAEVLKGSACGGLQPRAGKRIVRKG